MGLNYPMLMTENQCIEEVNSRLLVVKARVKARQVLGAPDIWEMYLQQSRDTITQMGGRFCPPGKSADGMDEAQIMLNSVGGRYGLLPTPWNFEAVADALGGRMLRRVYTTGALPCIWGDPAASWVDSNHQWGGQLLQPGQRCREV
jgi:hypothetical protein